MGEALRQEAVDALVALGVPLGYALDAVDGLLDVHCADEDWPGYAEQGITPRLVDAW